MKSPLSIDFYTRIENELMVLILHNFFWVNIFINIEYLKKKQL